jgi:hypothetical protein
MKIPQALFDAKGAVEAFLERDAAIGRKNRDVLTAGTQAAAHIPEVDQEITTLIGALLQDDALKGVADDERMTAPARAEGEKRLAALRKEREGLTEQVARSAAGSAALANIAADRAQDLIEPATAFVREWRLFDEAIHLEFRRDVARLTLPDLLTKWFCIMDGLGYSGFVERLKETKIVGRDAVLVLGRYHDPDTGETIDYQGAWRSDAVFVELHRDLATVRAFERRVSPIVAADRLARHEVAERQRLDEQDRLARLTKMQMDSAATVDASPPSPDPWRGASFSAPPGGEHFAAGADAAAEAFSRALG